MRKFLSVFLTLCLTVGVLFTSGITVSAEEKEPQRELIVSNEIDYSPISNSHDAVSLTGDRVDSKTRYFVSPDGYSYIYYKYDKESELGDERNVPVFTSIAGYSGNEVNLEIPDTLGGLPVATIESKFLYNNSTVRRVVVPDSMWYFQDATFYGMKALQEADLGNFPGISSNCFNNCVALTTVKHGTLTKVLSGAFRGCKSLVSINLGGTLNQLGESAFENCIALESVTLPDTLEKIPESVFAGCTSLDTAVIGNSITEIGNYAFQNCTSLRSIELPDTLLSVGNSAFKGCLILTRIEVPEGCSSIGDNAFQKCQSLGYVTLGNQTTYVGKYAFSECIALRQVQLGEKTSYLGDSCFEGDTSLKTITLTDSVKNIAPSTFYGCSKLESIDLGNSIKTIGSSSFRGCKKLKSISIPESVSKIEKNAFYGCESLESVYLHEGLLSILEKTFSNCDSLLSIKLPDTLTFIGEEALGYLNGRAVEGFTIYCVENSCSEDYAIENSFSYRLYSGDYSYDRDTLNGNTVVTIYRYLGEEEQVEVPAALGGASVGKIVSGAFSNLTKAKVIHLPNSVKVVEEGAFTGCIKDLIVVVDVDNATIKSVCKTDGVLYHSDKECIWGEWVVTREPTDEETGSKERYCLYCNKREEVTIPCNCMVGDLNGDGKINLLDLVALRKHLAKWSIEVDLRAADCNADGKVNLLDLVLLRKYLAKWNVILGKPA